MPKKNGNGGTGISIAAILIAIGALMAQMYPGFDFIDRESPIVGIVDPDLNDNLRGIVSIRGIVYDTSNYTLSIQINGTEIGTQLPLFWNSSTVEDGNYSLSVYATDSFSNQGYDSIHIMIINHLEQDSDHDGLNDTEELKIGTNPLQIDTDLDNFNDGYEISYGSDPLNATDFPLLHEADFNAFLTNLEGNATLVQQLISWAEGNSTILHNLWLNAETNASLVHSLVQWSQQNATLLQDLITWSVGNASLLTNLFEWSAGNATIIANLVATSNIELVQNLQMWLAGNVTLIESLCTSLEGNATLLANLVEWSQTNATIMQDLVEWCNTNATLLQEIITWTMGNATLLQEHLAMAATSSGNITRLWYSQYLPGLMPSAFNTPENATELEVKFTISGNETVYLNFNSGYVALYNTNFMKVNFMLDGVPIINPFAQVQSSSGTTPDNAVISLQHILTDLAVGNHNVTIQYESDNFCILNRNSLVVLSISE